MLIDDPVGRIPKIATFQENYNIDFVNRYISQEKFMSTTDK